jgi:hypothetical protein
MSNHSSRKFIFRKRSGASITSVIDPQAQELGPFHVPIVPMSVKAPVPASMLYMETSFEAEFVT